MMKAPDILFYYNSIKNKCIINTKKKYKTNKIDLKSITKLFVIFVLIWMYHNKLIQFTDPIVKYLPKFKYSKIRIIDIINHTCGLQNDWFEKNIKGQFQPTPLAKKYFKSRNIYEFSAYKLKMIPDDYGVFKYNNYTYDILGLLIFKLTNRNYLQLLQKIFPKAKFSARYAADKIPFMSHSLFIRYKDLSYISKKIIEYDFYSDIMKHRLAEHVVAWYQTNVDKSENWIGHSGSGGQLLLFNINSVFISFSYGNSDKHTRGLSEEDSILLLKKIKVLS